MSGVGFNRVYKIKIYYNCLIFGHATNLSCYVNLDWPDCVSCLSHWWPRWWPLCPRRPHGQPPRSRRPAHPQPHAPLSVGTSIASLTNRFSLRKTGWETKTGIQTETKEENIQKEDRQRQARKNRERKKNSQLIVFLLVIKVNIVKHYNYKTPFLKYQNLQLLIHMGFNLFY